MKGIDISHHNGVIDFAKVKSAGIDFAIIRAGYGTAIDNKFHSNIVKAKAAGIAVGVYWFAYALNPAAAIREADYCHKLIMPYKLDLPVFYDFEYDTERYAGEQGVKYTPGSRTAIIKTFCDRVKALGRAVGVYLNPDYITSRTNYAVLKPYTLWIARWTAANGAASFASVPDTKVDNSYNKVAIWQFGMGKVDGISGNVDIDYGYFDLPVIKPVPVKPPVKPPVTFKKGEKARVINTVTTGSAKHGKTYTGGVFRVYNDTYDVISASGDRVCIGIGKAVTAAVNAKNLEKVIK